MSSTATTLTTASYTPFSVIRTNSTTIKSTFFSETVPLASLSNTRIAPTVEGSNSIGVTIGIIVAVIVFIAIAIIISVIMYRRV